MMPSPVVPNPARRHGRCLAGAIAIAIAIAISLASGPGAAATEPCAQSFEKVFETLAPSVVRVMSLSVDPFQANERFKMTSGTGIAIEPRGHVLTNAHVIVGATEVGVSVARGKSASAEVVGVDPVTDLAVVRIPELTDTLTPAPFGRSNELRVGQEVLAVGHPLGLGRSASRGIVSAVNRVLPLSSMSWMVPMIQTDAAVSKGSSGGPLVDRCARVIGINTLVIREGENLAFATPADVALAIASELIETGRVSRPWHGVNGQLVPPFLTAVTGMPGGFLVETVEPGSAAEQAGLRGGRLPVALGPERFLIGGDVIVGINDEELADMETVRRLARGLKVGDVVRLEVWREGQMLPEIEATLPERPLLEGDLRRLRGLR